MLTKAQSLSADQIFLDLEDSVAPIAKEEARDNIIQALREGDWNGKTRVVRINGCETAWTFRDVIAIVEGAGEHLDCVMIPKTQNASHVFFVDRLIRQIELEKDWQVGRIGLEIQIEDAEGLVNAGEILASSSRIETLIFGPGDMAAALGMPSLTVGELQPNYPGDHWHSVLFTILVQARNAGVQAIDGPYANIKDLDGFRKTALRSRTIGFDGKWVLHPAQIDAANEIFGESQDDYERAVDILEAFTIAVEVEGRGAVMFGDEMIDEASRRLALVTAEKGEREGVVYRSVPPQIPIHERRAWRAKNLHGGGLVVGTAAISESRSGLRTTPDR